MSQCGESGLFLEDSWYGGDRLTQTAGGSPATTGRGGGASTWFGWFFSYTALKLSTDLVLAVTHSTQSYHDPGAHDFTF